MAISTSDGDAVLPRGRNYVQIDAMDDSDLRGTIWLANAGLFITGPCA